MKKRHPAKNFIYTISPVLVFLLLFALWEWAIAFFEVPKYVLVAPSTIIEAWIDNAPEILEACSITIQEILYGYVIGVSIGIIVALIFTSNQFFNRAISPYVIFLICTPQMVLIPLLMLKLGFGISLKVAAVALSSFPINMLSTQTGVRSVSTDRYELMQSLRATKLQTFFRVLIPSALPNVFTGMRLATIFATTSAVGAELLCSTAGIGKWVSYYSLFLRMDICFAYVVTMVVISVSFYLIISGLEHLVVKRYQ